MSYPNGRKRNIVLIRPKRKDVYYLYYDNAVLRGVQDMLCKRYRHVQVARRNGRVITVIHRFRSHIVVRKV